MNQIKKNKRGDEGQALVVVTVFFTVVAIGAVLGVTSPIINARRRGLDQRADFTAEAGSEDAFYRIKNSFPVSYPATFSIDDVTASISVNITGVNEQEIISEGNATNHIRTVLKDVTVADGFSFHSAVQVGNGGLGLNDNAVVVGNVYANARVKAVGNNTRIDGGVVSAGPGGVIEHITAFGDAYAHEIKGESRICGDAYYQVIDGSSSSFIGNPGSPCPTPYTLGTAYAGSVDQPLADMPIPDSLLDEWESQAVAGGPIIDTPCPYKITSGTVSLGPIKIDCDLEVSGNFTTVILEGTVWVNGNFTINNNPKFRVSDEVGNKSVPVIVRSVANPVQRGLITLNNSPQFFGSQTDGIPNPDSYVMFVSRNIGAESASGDKAIVAGNNIGGNLLIYAPHGEIELSNNVILRSVTAHTLTLRNNVQVQYSIGLGQPLFTSGPGGQWKIKRWHEI